jgi:3-methyladenine DNA glycosylase/8-oxoguanine DNA glycosylase
LPASRKLGGAGPEPGVHTAAAREHLQAADPVMRTLIDELGDDSRDPRRGVAPDDHYGALIRSIVGQQLSTKAARAIYARLTDRYGGRTPTPVEVLEDDPDELRAAAGLSRAMMLRYGLDELPAPAEMEELAEPWRPHRTLACLYLWRSLAVTPL